MTRNSTDSQDPTFGYLTVLELADHGYFGGYLIICPLGRPLEFHCTAPVRPSAAQDILYGPALRPYLLGELIGGALVAAATRTPRLILTDQQPLFSLRSRLDVPLVLVGDPPDAADDDRQQSWQLAGRSLELPPGFAADRDAAGRALAELVAEVDLAEPFERIHLAIREAQRISDANEDDRAEAA